MKTLLILSLALYGCLLQAQQTVTQTSYISSERVREIATFLPETPQGIGSSCKDRAFWESLKPLKKALKGGHICLSMYSKRP